MKGDILAGRLSIEESAVLTGRVELKADSEAQPKASSPAAPAVSKPAQAQANAPLFPQPTA